MSEPHTPKPNLRSWLASANEPGCDFPIENLPFGVFREPHAECICIGVAIGDQVLDLHGIADEGLLSELPTAIVAACRHESLNRLMSLGRAAASQLRQRVSQLLSSDAESATQDRVHPHLYSQRDVTMLLPATIGDYTDFYASIEHATRVGSMFRPDKPLLPNYRHVPIGYHGRASSIVVSGTPVQRPLGQQLSGDAPIFAPTRMLDYEAELGFFIGPGNALGEPIPIDAASDSIFGYCLVNDWSARDIQSWEYQPLGPFLAKNFGTSISPWIVTADALAPFRMAARGRAQDEPTPLAYLVTDTDQKSGALSIQIEVRLTSALMREQGIPPLLLSSSNARNLYWTPAQMLAHHASNGCNLRPADLLASGTVSGPGDSERACLLEITSRGAQPITLPTGETRGFLEDGDEVVLTAFCEQPGVRRIGFGECRGRILPAR